MGLVGGVLIFNAVLLGVGYCLLWALLGRSSLVNWLSYAGVALLVGAGATGVVLNLVVVLGSRLTLPMLFSVCAGLALASLAGAHRFGPICRPVDAARDETQYGLPSVVAATVAAGLLGAVLVLIVVAAFRSEPSLDDSWTMWIPKGLALDRVGLDPRLFAPSGHYLSFSNLDYPLWWSIVSGLDLRFVGKLDLRSANAQAALLLVAFFAAALRVLWGRARAWLLWLSLLVLAVSPQLIAYTQEGGADLPLAIYLALFVTSSVVWLRSGDRGSLVLVFVFGATAILTKSEGAPELIVLAVGIGLCCVRVGRRPQLVWAVTIVAAFIAAAPWLIWRQAHHATSLSDVSLSNATDPSYLLHRTARIGPAASYLFHGMINPHEWLILLPLLLALTLLATIRTRQTAWLAPWVVLGLGFVFWTYVNWADPLPLTYRLHTSALRVVAPLLLIAGLALPVVADHALTGRRLSDPPRMTE